MVKSGVLVVIAAVLATVIISTAATAFAAITEVDPYMKSAWRLEITALCYLFPMICLYRSSKEAYKAFLKTYFWRTALAGSFLGAHYCLWVLSINLTSVTHSLLFVSSTPILMIIYFFIIKKPVKKSEIVGTIVGCAGMAIICIEQNSPEGATVLGDFIALLGAVAIGMHFSFSEDLVTKGGICYLFVMHLFSVATCFLVSFVYRLSVDDFGGFFVKIFELFYTEQGLYAVYLGIFVGFVGNGCFYFMLKYTSPLVIVILIFFEPVTGSIVAWICGFQREPSLFTWVGGFIILLGNFIVAVFAKLKTGEVAKIDAGEEEEEVVEKLDKSLIN